MSFSALNAFVTPSLFLLLSSKRRAPSLDSINDRRCGADERAVAVSLHQAVKFGTHSHGREKEGAAFSPSSLQSRVSIPTCFRLNYDPEGCSMAQCSETIFCSIKSVISVKMCHGHKERILPVIHKIMKSK